MHPCGIVFLQNYFPIFFALFLCLYLFTRPKHRNLRHLPYPPGPPPLPFVGNLFDIAWNNEPSVYQRLTKRYGDIVFLSTLGKHVLLVNSLQVARDLFEKRSSTYSDRPQSTMSHELIGWDFSFSHMPYGDRWKEHRKMFHKQFQQSIARNFQSLQKNETHTLLRNLLRSPEDLNTHLRHTVAAVIMSITYGIKIAPKDDPFVSLAEKALEGVGVAANPGAFLVDFLPILKYVPKWFPGASFQRKAREWREATIAMKDLPFEAAMRTGNHTASFVSNLLNEMDNLNESIPKDVTVIKNCAAVVYAAASESTVSSLSSFILAMLTYPEVQARGQEEIDRVIGRERLPDFEDRAALPYISAIVSEVFRWNPVAPLGLPHRATKDDEFCGYYIPAGTIVIGNSWAILNDPETFSEPRRFNPERFMTKLSQPGCAEHLSPTSVLSVAFGYGRRLCPGRFVGDAQVWISVASILSVFEIKPPLDERGTPIIDEPRFTDSGFICHPRPFKFSMKPRGQVAKALIERTKFNI